MRLAVWAAHRAYSEAANPSPSRVRGPSLRGPWGKAASHLILSGAEVRPASCPPLPLPTLRRLLDKCKSQNE